MSISVTGLGSGLNYDSWISALVAVKQKQIDAVSAKVTSLNKKESTLSTIQSDFNSLKSAIESFTNALSSDDVFNQKAATSSSSAITATATTNANIQNLKVSVSKLATATKASSASVAASYADSNSKMNTISAGAFKAGTFSVYVNGQKNSISITADETLGSVVSSLNNISGVSASISNDGKLSITGSNVTVGSSSDTSNFRNLMALTGSTGSYSSSKSLFDTDTSAALVGGNYSGAAITAGSFTIGSAKFTIDSTTTMDGLVKQINGNANAGVTASWDSTTGKLNLVSNDQGATNINITAGTGTAGEAGASNFTDVMGLTSSTWNTDGTLKTTALASSSQTLGSNAVLSINGTEITSASNTVSSDISGIKGLTLTLNSTTSSDATVSVAQDTSKIVTAVTKVVSAYNVAISDASNSLTTDGDLYGETILKSMINSMRSVVTGALGGSNSYKTLASIGISTGAFTTNPKADTSQLKLDSDALTKALTTNSDDVKTLLVGNSSGTTGVFDKMDTILSNATNVSNGYFVKREASYQSQVGRLNKQVTSMTTSLEKYQSSLETKFAAMDTLISNLKSSASVFDSYFSSSSKSS